MEENNCPKPDCGRPESNHRYSAGKRLSICGNGHSWDAAELAAQRAKAREAQAQESRGEGGYFGGVVFDPYRIRVRNRFPDD